MASTVLFIVSIPTEDEEVRLKAEFIAKKLEQRRTEQHDIKTVTNTKGPPPLADMPELIDYDDDIVSDDNKPDIVRPPSRRKSEAALKLNAEESSALAANNNNTAINKQHLRPTASASTCLKDLAGGEDMTTPTARKSSEDVLKDLLQTAKLKSEKGKDEKPLDLDKPSDASMELVVREILKKFQVNNAVWSKDTGNRLHQIVFTVQFNEIYEQILDKFHDWGIGDRAGSVAVMNCVTSKQTKSVDESFEADSEEKQGAWDRFMNSVRSRLNVTQIVQNVRQDAAITFDFLVLLCSAAILAAFGLVENSTVFLVASMLISPLMGPIIAGIFGTVVKDSKLCALGLKNELFGILAATSIGFLFGLIVCSIDDRYASDEGISQEIISRCELHSLLVGVFTAIPSGAAAAVGILGGNVGSLVGVAISASLLPPAVNTGLLFSLACVYKLFEHDDTRYNKITNTSYYSESQAIELTIMATISMCLTISNIICVYFMGIIVLKVKEIAPVSPRNNNEFWKHDIKIIRDMRRTGFETDNAFIDEFANLPSEDKKALGLDSEMLRDMRLNDSMYQNTWSPYGMRHNYDGYMGMRDNYTTVHQHPFQRMFSRQDSHEVKRNRNTMTGGQVSRRHTGRAADMNTSYHLLSEHIPRCKTMPSKPTVTIRTPGSDDCTPTGINEENKFRRKFTVTPAEDPLLNLNDETDA